MRPHWSPLVDSLSAIGHGGLLGRWQEGRRLLHDNGVTYNVYGDPAATDCNDNDASENHFLSELCGDNKDNNCNGSVDENCACTGSGRTCYSGDPATRASAQPT